MKYVVLYIAMSVFSSGEKFPDPASFYSRFRQEFFYVGAIKKIVKPVEVKVLPKNKKDFETLKMCEVEIEKAVHMTVLQDCAVLVEKLSYQE